MESTRHEQISSGCRWAVWMKTPLNQSIWFFTQQKFPCCGPITKIFQDAMDVFQAKKGLSQPPHTDWLWIPGEAAISKING